MRHGHKSHSKGFEGYRAAIVAETESGVILATDIRAGNVHDREGAADLVAQAVERSGQELEEVLGDTECPEASASGRFLFETGVRPPRHGEPTTGVRLRVPVKLADRLVSTARPRT